jgi:hypothetical protein
MTYSTDDNVHIIIQPATLIQPTPTIKMNPLNQQALGVMLTQGTSAAVKHMFTHETTGQHLTYSEMRERYG